MKIVIMSDNPTNADIVMMFEEHSTADHAFQEETRATDKSIQETLERIEVRLGGIENKLDPNHKEYILTETNTQMALFNEIYNGFRFGRAALIWTSGAIGAVAVIIGSIVATVQFLK